MAQLQQSSSRLEQPLFDAKKRNCDCQLNVHSVYLSVDELKTNNRCIDILTVSETWFNSNLLASEIYQVT